MKKTYDYVKSCALCERSCFVEYDEKYICKYKNRCTVVEDTDCCRHFKFDLLKLEPPPKLPYKADSVGIISISPADTDENNNSERTESNE
jgi:hypothetical protein